MNDRTWKKISPHAGSTAASNTAQLQFTMNAKEKYRLGFYEWLWLFIGAASGLSILLLVLKRFNPVYVTISALIIVILVGAGLGLRFAFKWDRRFNLALFAILAVALFFRWGPYPHHSVGQDQGLYVNMAKVFARSGSLDFNDPLRPDLSAQQQKLYDANGGVLFQSAVPVDDSKTKIRICFYPLHPAWMAIFSSGLGESGGGYSVVFFSLLAIVGLYLLTLEIANNQKAAYTAALFAALNPGLIFFAKFPASEMVALAFASNGFYFLYRGYRQLKEEKVCWIFLALAAGCFNAFFYTRMSAAYYLPFMALILLCGLIDLPNHKQRIKIIGLFLCLAVLFGLSWLFYSQFLTPLFSDIVNQFSRRLLGPLKPHRIPVLTAIGFIFCTLVLFVMWWVKSPARRAKVQTVLRKLSWLAPVLIIIILAMHPVWRIIGNEQANFDYRKFINDVPGWHMFFYSSIYRYILYLSPIGFVLLIIGVFSRKIRKNGLAALAVAFLACMMAACLLQPYSAYAFYYDRYYLSEVIPCALMLIAIIIAPAAPRGSPVLFTPGDLNLVQQVGRGVSAEPSERAAYPEGSPYRSETEKVVLKLSVVHTNLGLVADRWLRGGAAALIAAYFAFFSLCQLGKTEGSYPDFFYEINKTIGSNDLLLCDQYNPDLLHAGDPGYRRPVNAPLAAYFNIKIFPLRSESELNRPEITELAQKYDNVYFLTYDQCHNPDFVCVKTLRYTEGFFIAGSHAWTDSSAKIMKNRYDYLLPCKHYEFRMPVYLYRQKKSS